MMQADQEHGAEHGTDYAELIEQALQEEGVESALALMERAPDDREAWDRGLAQLRQEEDAPGIAAWTSAMRAHFPEDSGIAATNAWTVMHTEGPEAGLPLWQAAVACFPGVAEMRRGYATALFLAGHADEGDATLSQAVRDMPDDRQLRMIWAETAAERGDFLAAAQRYEETRTAFPDHLPAYVGVAESLSRLGRHQDAYAILRQTGALFEGAPEVEEALQTVSERAAEAGVALTEAPIQPAEPSPVPERPVEQNRYAPETESAPDPERETQSPAWAMLRGEAEYTIEGEAVTPAPAPQPQPEPEKPKGLFKRLFGR